MQSDTKYALRRRLKTWEAEQAELLQPTRDRIDNARHMLRTSRRKAERKRADEERRQRKEEKEKKKKAAAVANKNGRKTTTDLVGLNADVTLTETNSSSSSSSSVSDDDDEESNASPASSASGKRNKKKRAQLTSEERAEWRRRERALEDASQQELDKILCSSEFLQKKIEFLEDTLFLYQREVDYQIRCNTSAAFAKELQGDLHQTQDRVSSLAIDLQKALNDLAEQKFEHERHVQRLTTEFRRAQQREADRHHADSHAHEHERSILKAKLKAAEATAREAVAATNAASVAEAAALGRRVENGAKHVTLLEQTLAHEQKLREQVESDLCKATDELQRYTKLSERVASATQELLAILMRELRGEKYVYSFVARLFSTTSRSLAACFVGSSTPSIQQQIGASAATTDEDGSAKTTAVGTWRWRGDPSSFISRVIAAEERHQELIQQAQQSAAKHHPGSKRGVGVEGSGIDDDPKTLMSASKASRSQLRSYEREKRRRQRALFTKDSSAMMQDYMADQLSDGSDTSTSSSADSSPSADEDGRAGGGGGAGEASLLQRGGSSSPSKHHHHGAQQGGGKGTSAGGRSGGSDPVDAVLMEVQNEIFTSLQLAPDGSISSTTTPGSTTAAYNVSGSGDGRKVQLQYDSGNTPRSRHHTNNSNNNRQTHNNNNNHPGGGGGLASVEGLLRVAQCLRDTAGSYQKDLLEAMEWGCDALRTDCDALQGRLLECYANATAQERRCRDVVREAQDRTELAMNDRDTALRLRDRLAAQIRLMNPIKKEHFITKHVETQTDNAYIPSALAGTATSSIYGGFGSSLTTLGGHRTGGGKQVTIQEAPLTTSTPSVSAASHRGATSVGGQ